MSVLYFRLGDHYSHRDRFRNPIWEYDEDDDDMDDFRFVYCLLFTVFSKQTYFRTKVHFRIHIALIFIVFQASQNGHALPCI